MSSTNEVCFLVDVEVDAMNRSTHILILKHAFCTISKWDDRQSISTYWHSLCQVVHFRITHALWSHRAAHPSIEDTCAIDAKKHTQTSGVQFRSWKKTVASSCSN